MTRHISGLILFSFIVGISVFVFAVTESAVPASVSRKNFTVFGDYQVNKKKRRKHKRRYGDYRRRKTSEITLDRAVFDTSTGNFSATLLNDRMRPDGNVDLHFYANDRFGPRFLKTERIAYTGTDLTFTKELRWMKFMDEDQKVFVIAGYNSDWGDATIPPDFDLSKAMPVAMGD